MPYPPEHAARIEDPSRFVRLRRVNDDFGEGIDVIYGVDPKRPGPRDGVTTVQSIRFDVADYTPAQAKRWLHDNGFVVRKFEPAVGRTRGNPGGRRPNPRAKATQRYRSAHWGVDPEWARAVEHPEIPNNAQIVQMGYLLALEFRPLTDQRRRECMEFPVSTAHLAFTQDRTERLICLVSAAARKRILAQFGGGPWESLPDVAGAVGGRQADYPCADVAVCRIGRITNVIYRTEKVGDDLSDYKHRMGEAGGIEPMLCCDVDGYLYVAGGSYRVPDRGIIH